MWYLSHALLATLCFEIVQLVVALIKIVTHKSETCDAKVSLTWGTCLFLNRERRTHPCLGASPRTLWARLAFSLCLDCSLKCSALSKTFYCSFYHVLYLPLRIESPVCQLWLGSNPADLDTRMLVQTPQTESVFLRLGFWSGRKLNLSYFFDFITVFWLSIHLQGDLGHFVLTDDALVLSIKKFKHKSVNL